MTESKHKPKALADATAGVVATVVAVWCFYPLDMWKTQLQAGIPRTDNDTRSAAKMVDDNELISTLQERMRSLFNGIGPKSLHAAGSSFCYFYMYSWILDLYHRRCAVRSNNGRDDKRQPPLQVSTTVRLILSALAAASNTLVTLPLDVVSTRRQTRQMFETPTGVAPNTTRRHNNTVSPTLALCRLDFASLISDRLRNVQSLWSGLLPSLVLCLNPAINFTVFDTIKSIRLQKKRNQEKLSMLESFVLGLLAKFAATIVTYPLIRAKVVMIVSKQQQSLLHCLVRHYTDGGVRELYRGCDLQLLHTVLKSALMMMIRERITQVAHRWL